MVSKKGGAASSTSSTPHHQFKVGDIVLAKIKGFPAWPGILVGTDQTPSEVLKEKPKDKFVIRFFPKADYHFPGAKDLSLLTREDCRAYAEDSHRKDGELKAAYRTGADPDEWVAQTDKVVRDAEQAKEQEELEAQEQEDQLQDDNDDDEGQANSSSTKKRSAEDQSGSSKSASKTKKPKTEKKPSSTGPRKSAGASSATAAAAAEDDAADSSAAGGDADDPSRLVRAWRHTMQRAFLPKDRMPTEQDVEYQGEMFTVVEKADITAEQLRTTKINKVMRKIVGLEKIPLDETHHFRERAEALLARWNAVLNASEVAKGAEAGKDDVKNETGASTSTNGNANAEPNGTSTSHAAQQQAEANSAAPKSDVDASTKTVVEDPPQQDDVGDLTELPDETKAGEE
ncbi:unnamed protein product [Sympodiomycopsis kandeliae]